MIDEVETWCGFEILVRVSLTGQVSFSGTSMGAGGMTTVWRPRVRIPVPEVDDEVEVGVEVPEELTKKGTKRKKAPNTKGPCEHGVKYRSQCKVCGACPHGRQRSKCKECGGSSICELSLIHI